MFFNHALILFSLSSLVLARSRDHMLYTRSMMKRHSQQQGCHHHHHNATTTTATSTVHASPSPSPSPSSRPSRSNFTLTDMYKGQTFLDGWSFFTGSDPTNGLVNYVDQNTATSARLAYIQPDGTTVLAVDNTTKLQVGSHRNSVRIQTQKTYNGGLFITDVNAMPTGCSVWPAWWSVGPNWPEGGEIDVIEGVNTGTQNQYTLHTSDNCSLDANVATPSAVSGHIVDTTCASSSANNNGCAFIDSDARSFGEGFNKNGGGVYAHLWDSTGIKAWHFARNEVPQDITDSAPDPTSWGTPAAFWSAKSCDMATHFYDHVLTFDTTLCGDWAGSVYNSFGCPGTCAEAVADPSNFHNAQWKINYVAVYDN